MGRTPKLFIAFLAITAFAVSTMNLTYKINYFEKKPVEQKKTVQNVLGILENLQKKQTTASLPLVNNSEVLTEPSATTTEIE